MLKDTIIQFFHVYFAGVFLKEEIYDAHFSVCVGIFTKIFYHIVLEIKKKSIWVLCLSIKHQCIISRWRIYNKLPWLLLCNITWRFLKHHLYVRFFNLLCSKISCLYFVSFVLVYVIKWFFLFIVFFPWTYNIKLWI